ncbi:hypothetical protein GCM10022276_24370 [Sphingomonas limnosediminicola]|jgi:hypothetical protein|uniref:Secreted protein n=1 Tax=Sphingomonas limnosediminicola TaxID=940133 RepID=A0ABP7LMJ8_9SPHN
MRRILMTAVAVALASSAGTAGVPVRVVGHSNADGELLKDILQNVTYFGAAFDCPAPSVIQTSVISPSRVPRSADYRVDSDQAGYEDWKANFCGKTEDFLIAFWPDPNGGSFIKVTYPYPDGAPHGGR